MVPASSACKHRCVEIKRGPSSSRAGGRRAGLRRGLSRCFPGGGPGVHVRAKAARSGVSRRPPHTLRYVRTRANSRGRSPGGRQREKGPYAGGSSVSLRSHCARRVPVPDLPLWPHRLCLVNVGGWGAWPGDWVWVSFFTCEPGTLGGPPQPRLLCPCYLTGVKTRLCSSATAEGGRRHRGASGVLRGRARPPRDSRLRLAPCFLLCSLTFSRCLAHRGAADLALFATVLTALRPCEGSLLPALLFSSARGVQGCPPVLRAPSFVASLVAAACRHRAGSQRRAWGDGLVRAAEGPSV